MINLFIILLGFLVLILFFPKMRLVKRFVLSYPIGLGIITFPVTLQVENSGISKEKLLLLLVLLDSVLLFLTIFVNRKRLKAEISFPIFIKNSFLMIIKDKYFYVLFLISGFIVLLTLFWPVWDWDALSLYDMRGKFFAEGRNYQELINESHFFSNARPEKYYISYPLLTSVAHTFSYLDGFSSPKWIYLFFSVGLVFSFYIICRDFGIDKKISLLLIILLFINPIILRIWTIAYTNSPYMFYLFWAVIALFYWVRDRSSPYLLLGSLMLAFSIQTRFADNLFIPVLLSLFTTEILFNKKKQRFLLILIPLVFSVFSYIFWIRIVGSLDLGGYSYPFSLRFIANLLRGFEITRVYEVIKYFVSATSIFHATFLVFFVALFVMLKKVIRFRPLEFRALFYLSLTLLSILAFELTGIYIMSFTYYKWNRIPGSVRRAVLPVFPIIFLYVGIIYKKLVGSNFDQLE